MIQDIQAGKKLSAAMRGHAELFDAKIVAAIEAGEETGNLAEVATRIAAALERGDLEDLPASASGESRGAGSDEAARQVNEIILEAMRSRASDVALEVLERGRLRVRQRIDGVMHETRVLPDGAALPVIDRLKAMASLNLAERRLPQDGRIMMQMEGEDVDIRISVLPAFYGERACLRLLRRQEVLLGLDRLGLNDEHLATVRRFCDLPAGIVIVNGPTGCGKTTLLYSMIQEMNQDCQAILTVEDPVELSIEKISQTQIRPEIGLTFPRAIRSILRQGPDVIMVGEIRDREILEICVQCAMTGHLVLTTLHAATSPGAIRRMLDIGLPPFMVNSSLAGVISMRLARKVCPDCREQAGPDLAKVPQQAREILSRYKERTLYKARGCPSCSQTGYVGRTGLYEILVVDDGIRQMVTADASIGQIREAALRSGMKTMLEDGLDKAAKGITTLEEVLRIVPTEAYE